MLVMLRIYIYIYIKKEHFNNLLKSTIFVQMNSMSWVFNFFKWLKMFKMVVDESELPAPMIQIPAALLLEGLKLIQRYSL